MKPMNSRTLEKLQSGIPLKIRRGHTVRLETTEDFLTVHTGLSLLCVMAEALEIPRILDEHIQVKQRERGYPESEHILALAANAFIGGDFLDDLEALQEDVAIQKAIGRKDIPDPTTAADFCRRFTLGHILQFNRALGEIQGRVHRLRPKMKAWTIDTDAKAHEVFGEKKEGAARNYHPQSSPKVNHKLLVKPNPLYQNQKAFIKRRFCGGAKYLYLFAPISTWRILQTDWPL
jgi:hypothetical protein